MRRAKSAAPDGFGPIVALPQGLALSDGIRQVTARSEWEAWLASSASAALAPLGGYRDDRRLVLVGRSGASCPSWTIARTPASGYRVRIGEDRAGTASGCAFLLPRDGLPVTLEE